jgi:MFS transporter, OFA family, oxalate/formate antiporter
MNAASANSRRIFYGWWVALAAFLNLFFAVGIVFYGFPVFYASLVDDLGFTRSQVTEGILWGFVLAAPFSFLLGRFIDRLGPERVIQWGLLLVGLPLVLMGSMSKLWQYYALSIAEVLGYILAGPISNQILVSNWFDKKRGRAMGWAYLGLGTGGVAAPLAAQQLITRFGWRHAFEITGILIMAVLFPVGWFVTRSSPGELGLFPDGGGETKSTGRTGASVGRALGTVNFWLILGGSSLVIGAIGTVIQQFVLFLRDQGYSTATAARFSSALLLAGLAGRVIVGYLADRFQKKNVMTFFYLLVAVAIPLLFLARRPGAVWLFALLFGFAMGADYMLIPLVTAECFGLASLGQLLTAIIMADSLGQWFGPWSAGQIFQATGSYNAAWAAVTAAGIVGAVAISAVNPARNRRSEL